MANQLKGTKLGTPITTTPYGSSACNEKAAAELAPIINGDRPDWAVNGSAAKPMAPTAMIGNGMGAAFNPKRS